MSGHTPGPWTAAQLGKGDPYHVKGGKYELNVCNTNTGAFGCDESIENARLISAAPELMEALSACLVELEREYMPTDESSAAIDKARAAIAKAKGIAKASQAES